MIIPTLTDLTAKIKAWNQKQVDEATHYPWPDRMKIKECKDIARHVIGTVRGFAEILKDFPYAVIEVIGHTLTIRYGVGEGRMFMQDIERAFLLHLLKDVYGKPITEEQAIGIAA